MNWCYDKGYVDISMPNYIRQVLERFKHKKPKKLQYSPHQHVLIKFGSKTRQFAIEPDQTALLDDTDKKYVQQIVGCLLYYARVIDGTILSALNTIGSEQAKATRNTK